MQDPVAWKDTALGPQQDFTIIAGQDAMETRDKQKPVSSAVNGKQIIWLQCKSPWKPVANECF